MNFIKKLKTLHWFVIRGMRTYPEYGLYSYSREYVESFNRYSLKIHEQWREKDALMDEKCPLCGNGSTSLVIDKSAIDGTRYHKCPGCDFVYANPRPSEKYYNEIYESGYGGLGAWWDGKAVDISEEEDFHPPLELIKKRKKGGVFFDYGCGTGSVLVLARNDFEVYGVDLDEYRLKKARQRLDDKSGERIYDYGDLSKIDLKDKFDVIHCNQTIEHLLDPLKHLELFYEWLKPGGVLFLAAPASDSFAFSFLGEHNSMATLGHVSLFNRKSLESALKKCGFSAVDITNYYIDVSATEFWKRIFGFRFVHRHCYIKNRFIIALLYPFVLITTALLYCLCKTGMLRGNYFYAFAEKR